MKKIYIIVLILLIGILTACGTHSVNDNSERKISGKTKSILYSSTVASSEYSGMNVESIRFQGSEYFYTVKMPKLNRESWDKEMERLGKTAIDDFIKEAEEIRDNQKEPLELQIDFQVYSFSEQFLSVKIEQSVSRGGEVQKKTFSTHNFDRNSGEFIKFPDLFKEGSNFHEKLTKLSCSKLVKHPAVKAELSSEQFKKNYESIKEPIKHFLIKNDRLILLFDAGELGIQSSDELEITFSKYELRDVLKKKTVLGTIEEPSNKPGENKYVALTFDDGPHETVTYEILDVLKKYDARATFFVLGVHAEDHPEVLKRVAAEGHEIGNHTWGHPYLTEISQEKIKQDVKKADEFILNITGQMPGLLRPPYGHVNETVIAAVNKPLIKWSLDTRDWESQNPDAIFEKVQTKVKDGDIIIMHDTLPTTAEALELVLPWLYEQGYQVVTVSELLGFSANPELAQAGKVYYSRTHSN